MQMQIDVNTIILLIIITIIMMLITTYMDMKKQFKRKEYETLELLECENCKYRVEKSFEPGDFISMYKETCPKCNSRMKIKAIYSVEKTIK